MIALIAQAVAPEKAIISPSVYIKRRALKGEQNVVLTVKEPEQVA